jgi:hypothetical protein
MTDKKSIIPAARIERSILVIRGEKVMLDADLAVLYGVTTKRLNEQVKRNRDRFPKDFIFQLTEREKREVVANCDHLNSQFLNPLIVFLIIFCSTPEEKAHNHNHPRACCPLPAST